MKKHAEQFSASPHGRAPRTGDWVPLACGSAFSLAAQTKSPVQIRRGEDPAARNAKKEKKLTWKKMKLASPINKGVLIGKDKSMFVSFLLLSMILFSVCWFNILLLLWDNTCITPFRLQGARNLSYRSEVGSIRLHKFRKILSLNFGWVDRVLYP